MITVKQMRELERKAISRGILPEELMENAGRKVFEVVKGKIDLRNKHVVVFAGTGNNGGDGFVAARYFAEHFPVVILLFGEKGDLTEESLVQYELVKRKATIVKIKEKQELDLFHFQKGLEYVFIDALLGIGTDNSMIREPIASAIDHFNSLEGVKIAVDIPSGMNADTGDVADKACKVDMIVTFHDIKAGMEAVKDKTVIVDIGIPR